MDKGDEVVRQTVRFPKRIHEAVEAARGNPKKPRPSFNEVLMDLVMEGLRATGQELKEEAEPGPWEPARLVAA
jgi:hypothetical protein